MMKLTSLTVVSAVSISLFSLALVASEEGDKMADSNVNFAEQQQRLKDKTLALYEKLDANKDKMLSREEVKATATLSAIFDKLDTNNDQLLTVSELISVSNAESKVTKTSFDK